MIYFCGAERGSKGLLRVWQWDNIKGLQEVSYTVHPSRQYEEHFKIYTDPQDKLMLEMLYGKDQLVFRNQITVVDDEW